jgi:predicted nucleic acid-binding protein
MRSTKKTVSLFQSHVFKHEFFLFPVARSLFPLKDAFFTAMYRGEFNVVTSVLTISEVLVYPLRAGNTILAQQYRDILFNSQGLTTIEVLPDIAENAAKLRADYNLRTPDAIQMATAIYGGASFFLTNDIRLPSLPGLTVLVLNQLMS